MTEHDQPKCAVSSKQPHPATHGHLCRGHLEQIGTWLREIEDESAILDASPSMAQRIGSSGGTLASERTPLRLEVVAFSDVRTRRWTMSTEPRPAPAPPKGIGPWCLLCEHETCTAWRAGRRRDLYDDEQDAGSDKVMSVHEVLAYWAGLVREGRRLTPPARITISGERKLLSRHLDWCARQSWITGMRDEIHELHDRLQGANGTLDTPVGTCTTLYEGNECGGRIRNHEIDHADGRPEPAFRCERCRRVWTGTQAVRLRDQLWRDEEAKKAERKGA